MALHINKRVVLKTKTKFVTSNPTYSNTVQAKVIAVTATDVAEIQAAIGDVFTDKIFNEYIRKLNCNVLNVEV